MSKYKIVKVLRMEDVREMCIKHQYYTVGDCKAYENMFNMLTGEDDIPDEVVEKIATDIKEHSRTDDTVEDIMTYLAFRIQCCVAPR